MGSSEYTIAGIWSTRAPYRASVACARSSLSRSAVMSNMIPCQYLGVPSGSRTSAASSRIHRISPVRVYMRYSARNSPPVRSIRSYSRRTRTRSSGWNCRAQATGSAIHSSGVKPRICSTCGLT